MSVGFDTWFPLKSQCTEFVVQNIADPKKVVRVFNYPVYPHKSRNLLAISFVSEADIRHSLLKGELKVKFLAQELIVTSSNIDLLQFDSCQLSFLESIGITNGLQVSGGVGELPVNFKQNVQLLGIKNNNNRIFTVPPPDKFINGIFKNNEFKILIRHNGRGLEENVDYIVTESGGSGTGYDTIVLLFSPTAKSQLICDYVIETV